MNRWAVSPTRTRILAVLGTFSALSAQQVAVALGVDVNLASVTLYQARLAGLVRHVPPTALQRHVSTGRGTTHAYAPSARAQLYLRGQWLTRPGRHLIALSELVDSTFRDREAFMINHPQPVLGIEAAA